MKFRILLFVALMSVTATAQDRRLQTLALDAEGLPSEFASDALIRIAGSGKVTDRRWKRALLDEAFMRAYGAIAQYRRTGPHVPLDSRQFAQIQAEDTPLARVALQSRAAQLMATVSPAR